MKKYKFSAQYPQNYACYEKKHRDIRCEYQCDHTGNRFNVSLQNIVGGGCVINYLVLFTNGTNCKRKALTMDSYYFS